MSLSNFYVYHRSGFGLRKAFRFAFGVTLRDALLDLTFYVVILALLTALVYFTTNQYVEAQEAAAQHKATYVANLERTLAKCLTPGDHPLYVGDELVFCGSAKTGVKK